MLINRYLLKDTTKTLVVMTGLIVVLFASNQFIHYLARASNGQLPMVVILRLMVLEIPSLMALLLPLGFFLALIIVLGRMNEDHELLVLRAMGMSQWRLLRGLLTWALLLSMLVMAMMCWLNPIIYCGRAKLIRSQGLVTVAKTILPQHFRSVDGGNRIFYLTDADNTHQTASGIFYAQRERGNRQTAAPWQILWADHASIEDGGRDHQARLVLHDGYIYRAKAGNAQAERTAFKHLVATVPVPAISFADDVRTVGTRQLLARKTDNASHAHRMAEFHWRIGLPIMLIVLVVCALPLSQGNTRQGRFARWVPAIILYTLYANGMFIGRDALSRGQLPLWMGLWWLHLAVLAIGLVLLYRGRWQ